MLAISSEDLYQEYVVNNLTDAKIAEKYKVDRTYISKLRKQVGIETRLNTGLIGENSVENKLNELGVVFMNMNTLSMTYEYDFLINNRLKIEVKSAKVMPDGIFRFTLSEKPENNNIVSDTRIRLKNGRTRKRFERTCDFVILVCLEEDNEANCYVIPSNEINTKQQTISISSSLNGKYAIYKDRWDFLLEEHFKEVMK